MSHSELDMFGGVLDQ